MDIARRTHIAYLFDFYGQLLTARQRQLVDLYYQQDLSLGEIAEAAGISRQAVHEQVKRAEEILEAFEAKLGLVERWRRSERLRSELVRTLEEVRERVEEDSPLAEPLDRVLDLSRQLDQ